MLLYYELGQQEVSSTNKQNGQKKNYKKNKT